MRVAELTNLNGFLREAVGERLEVESMRSFCRRSKVQCSQVKKLLNNEGGLNTTTVQRIAHALIDSRYEAQDISGQN
jgi:hypothetical protein